MATALAIQHPDRVDRLVLASATSGWPFTYPLPARSARLLTVGPMLPRAHTRRRQLRAMMSRQSMADRSQPAEQLSAYLSSRPHHSRSKRQQIGPRVLSSKEPVGVHSAGGQDDAAHNGIEVRSVRLEEIAEGGQTLGYEGPLDLAVPGGEVSGAAYAVTPSALLPGWASDFQPPRSPCHAMLRMRRSLRRQMSRSAGSSR